MFLARSTPTTAMAMAPLLIKDPPHIYEIRWVESIPLLMHAFSKNPHVLYDLKYLLPADSADLRL